MTTREWLRALPKAELHVHLEGTVNPQEYAIIARRNGLTVPEDPNALFQSSDFASFLDAIKRVVKGLKTPADFAEVTGSYLRGSAGEGVRHVELLFSPATVRFFNPDANLFAIVRAINAESLRVRSEVGITSLLIFDLVRNLGADTAMADLDLAVACKDLGVVGIGLGGDERRFPARHFQRVFERAAKLGLRRTAHAGEADGAHSIADALELLGAERIGHGVAAANKPELLQLVRDRGATIDACPRSNQITGAWKDRAKHPFRAFLTAGIAVTLGSDDPAFFGRSLLDEYEGALEHGASAAEIVQVARHSLTSSFASEKEKRTWLDELDAFVAVTPRPDGAFA